MHKIFRYPIFSETQKGFPTKFLATGNKKLSSENSEVPLLSVSFFDNRFFLKHRRLALRKFSVLWDKDFDKKSWYNPLFSYPLKFPIPEVFWNKGGLPYEIFRYCETKTLTKNCDTTPSSIHNNFGYQKFSEKQKGCPTNVFGTVRQKFGKKIVPNPLFSYQK